MSRSILFFDLDGTLADSMAHIESLIVSMAVDELGMEEDVIRAELPRLLSLPASQSMPMLAELAGKDLGVLDQLMRGAAPPLTLFPEVPAVLERLATRYTLVLSTNTPAQGLDDRLADAGVLNYFRLVLGTDLTSGRVKGPAHIRLAATELGVAQGDLGPASVLIGDQEGDMRLAKEFGMAAVGRARPSSREALTAAGADALIDDLNGLEAALARIDGVAL